MKKILLLFLLAFPLTACNTDSVGNNMPVISEPSQSTVAKVQAAAKQACGFVPYVRTVVDIFTAPGGVWQSVASVASKICDAVTNNPMTEGVRGGRTIPTVNGVKVRGQFTNGRKL